MKFSRRDTIWRELKHHLPFTLVVSLFAGVLVALAFIFNLGSNGFLGDMFGIIHPAHILVSAAATAAIFRKYKKSVVAAGLIGVVGAILIGARRPCIYGIEQRTLWAMPLVCAHVHIDKNLLITQ